MNLSSLPKITTTKKRRLGQGHGSGRSKTAGRGTKGQKARGKIPMFFEGGALPLIKRLPFRRGKGKNRVYKKKPIVINITALNLFKKGSTVTVDALVKHKIIDVKEAKKYGVKILGDGDLAVALTIAVPVSNRAAKKIEKAGGNIQR